MYVVRQQDLELCQVLAFVRLIVLLLQLKLEAALVRPMGAGDKAALLLARAVDQRIFELCEVFKIIPSVETLLV